jgi:short-subunit dehydrogenase
MADMEQLRGATAIVTGASKGIGVYIARALAKEGVNLALAARSIDELEIVCKEMETLGVKAIAVQCDVTKTADRANLIARTEAELGPIDILVNNAGIERIARFEKAPAHDFSDTIAVNLEAPILLTHAIVPGMLARGKGHVVNIASGAGKFGVPFGTSYSATKHGLVGFTHSLRAEYHGNAVGFSVVCPGFVTDVGMYDRWEQGGVKAPKIVGSCSPEKVSLEAIDCIKKNRAEAFVNTMPLRPLVLLANIAPGVVPKMMALFGYTKTFKRVADLGIK